MEKFVVSRELAQRLKEAGLPQRSEYMWVKFKFADWMVAPNDFGKDIHFMTLSGERTGEIAAPMTDEILEQLPDSIEEGAHIYWLILRYFAKGDQRGHYWSETANKRLGSDDHEQGAIGAGSPLPDSLAKLWLW